MIERLLPPGVQAAEAAVRACALHPEEEALAEAMSPERRCEFASARACARAALVALGHPAAAVGRGERRMPLWPEGVVGSLTHRGGWCAAAVGHAADWLGIGIDLEPWQPLKPRVLERITRPAERAALAALDGRPPEHWGTVVFSAKESLFKALFPHTRRFLAFRDAEIELRPSDSHSGAFTAMLRQPESIARLGAERFDGRFARESASDRLWTGLAVPR